MSDLALKYDNGIIDLDLGDGGSAVDDGLRTAVIVSLFSDRLAETEDELPDNSNDLRGWWADIYPEVEGDLIGSRLWLLSRSKQLDNVVRSAEQYAGEALQWLIDDGIAARVDVVGSNPAKGVLTLEVSIHRPTGDRVDYRFDNIWEAIDAL